MATSQWDRRTILKGFGLTALAAGVGGMVTACSDSSSRAAAAGGGRIIIGPVDAGRVLKPGEVIEGNIYSSVAGSLPSGGTLQVAITQVLDTLNMLTSTSGNIQCYASPVHDFLERSDEKGQIVPSLASKLEMVDATTLRYTLHEATFHNGRKVVADDVVKTVDYVRSPELGSNRAGAFKDVKVIAVSDHVVEFRLPAPNAGFRTFLTGLAIIPVEAIGQLAESPVGCGPYKFKQWVKDSHVEYSGNPDYWASDLPRLETLRLNITPDRQAATQAMQAKQVDVLDQVLTAQVPQFEKLVEKKQVVGVSYAYSWLYMGLNLKLQKLSNVKVRQALAIALDRRAIALANGGSLNVPMCTAPYSPTSVLYPKQLDYPRDVRKAKQLLAEGGGSALTLDLLVVDEAGEAAATVIQSNLGDIGVKTTITRTDVPTQVTRRTEGNFEAIVNGWFLTSEPSFALDGSFSSGSPSNFWGYSNTRADELLKQGRSTLDAAARKPVYEELFKLVFIDEPSMIPICSQVRLATSVSGVNLEMIAPTPADFWRYTPAAKKSA